MMKKAIAFAVVLLVAFAPISFAADPVCNMAASSSYAAAASGKLLRGVANTGFGWVELIRQPTINSNKWEGVSKGVFYTGQRTVYGVVEAVTFLLPSYKTPQSDPACPLDMLG